jgi:hypothetical protein
MSKELKDILKRKGLTGKDLSGLLDMDYHSYRVATMKSREKFPRWVRAFVVGFKIASWKDK